MKIDMEHLNHFFFMTLKHLAVCFSLPHETEWLTIRGGLSSNTGFMTGSHSYLEIFPVHFSVYGFLKQATLCPYTARLYSPQYLNRIIILIYLSEALRDVPVH
jgi:hypothetical protein